MTVKELIEELQKHDPDTIVAIDNGECAVNIDEVVWYGGLIPKVVLR